LFDRSSRVLSFHGGLSSLPATGRTDLKGANLNRAHLEEANLNRAQLQGADLSEAHLESANLILAQLDQALLQLAFFDNATKLSWIPSVKIDFATSITITYPRNPLDKHKYMSILISSASVS